MKFNYEEWEPKVLAFLNKTWVPEKEEEWAFCDLIEEADYSNDVQAIKLLFFVYTRYDLNLDETILNTLSSMDYKIYYEVYFQNVHKLLNKGEFELDKYRTVGLSEFTLEDTTEDEYYKSKTVALLDWRMSAVKEKDFQAIFSNVIQGVSYYDMAILIKILEEWEYDDEDYDPENSTYVFYRLLKQTLKEAGKL